MELTTVEARILNEFLLCHSVRVDRLCSAFPGQYDLAVIKSLTDEGLLKVERPNPNNVDHLPESELAINRVALTYLGWRELTQHQCSLDEQRKQRAEDDARREHDDTKSVKRDAENRRYDRKTQIVTAIVSSALTLLVEHGYDLFIWAAPRLTAFGGWVASLFHP